MKLFIKTLKGEQFDIDANPEDTVAVVKTKVEAVRSDLPADRQKLIHTGKVLKDDTTLSSNGIVENNFIVCMVTKEAAKPAVPTPAPAAAPAPAPAPVTPAAPVPAAPALVTPSIPPVPPSTQFESPEAVQQLMDMGFVETDVRAALRAAYGNASVAVEYLMSGIPPQALRQTQQSAPSPAAAGSGGGLQELRRHPQFNMLKRLVQQNPASLGRVLEAIGQQNPELLRAIHADQPAFLAMMNEPIVDEPVAPQPQPGLGGPAGRNPAELLQLLMGLPEDMRSQAATSLGMSPEQLQGLTQMLASLPPEQLEQIMSGAGGMGGGNVVRLTEEEMAAVTRLTELGFDQQDAVAAYLACEKNEALAANLLLEGWTAGGGGGDMDIGDDGADDDYEGGDDMYH